MVLGYQSLSYIGRRMIQSVPTDEIRESANELKFETNWRDGIGLLWFENLVVKTSYPLLLARTLLFLTLALGIFIFMNLPANFSRNFQRWYGILGRIFLLLEICKRWGHNSFEMIWNWCGKNSNFLTQFLKIAKLT